MTAPDVSLIDGGLTRRCLDCGRDISDRHGNAKRCASCAIDRNRETTKLRQTAVKTMC
jgi:DNA-directed RNA polymerase subunit RPC12/RpoP